MRFKELLTAQYIITAIILLLLFVLSIFWLFRISIFENYLSKELNLNVKAHDITFGYGKIIVNNITVKNPRQTVVPNVLEIQKLEIDMNPLEFFKTKKKIDRVQISSPTIYIEFYNFDGSESDWSHILNSFSYDSSSLYTIKNLSLLEVYFNVSDFERNNIEIWPIPYIETKALDTEKGLPLTAIMKIIMMNAFSKIISDVSMEGFVESIQPLPPEIYVTPTVIRRTE